MTAAPSPPPLQDWTTGPAKWAAVIVLGGASIAGMAWSIFARHPAPITAPRPISQPATLNDAPTGKPAAPDTALQQPTTAQPQPPTTAAQPQLITAQPQPPTTTPQIQIQPQPTPAAPAPAGLRPARINLNTATAAELELLPGIGPVVAARIVDHRTKNGPFKTITALDAVKGIGPKTIEVLRPLVTVE